MQAAMGPVVHEIRDQQDLDGLRPDGLSREGAEAVEEELIGNVLEPDAVRDGKEKRGIRTAPGDAAREQGGAEPVGGVEEEPFSEKQGLLGGGGEPLGGCEEEGRDSGEGDGDGDRVFAREEWGD